MTLSSPSIAIIQARMASSRLPDKVLLDIGGQSMLKRVVERARRAKTVDQVVVATTRDPSDDPVAAYCGQNNYLCYRGDQYDVLDRYYQAARQFNAGVIVRITADCPVLDPEVVDDTVNIFLGADPPADRRLMIRELGKADENLRFPYAFVANRLPPPWGRTYPIGLDTEVCSFEALEIAWKEADQPHQREHVMPFFYDHLERFGVLLVDFEEDHGEMRWTVDTPADLELIRQIFALFGERDDFSWLEILSLFKRRPELAQINAAIRHKTYNEIDNRRKTRDITVSRPKT
jgi:spore coat polysaccharide biosynthesis protein SpsF